ncbi:MAG: hypothetical protein IPI49_31240 [Myxococcales bacterium]|nr:hypothetical protein [Myxococcales bacterium]
MNKSSLRLLAATAAFAFAVPGAPQLASARTALPSSGRAVNFADQGCFTLSHSSMTNTCSTTKTLEIPLTHDNSLNNWLNPRVTAFGAAPANNVGCNVIAAHKSLSYYWANSGGWEYLPAFGTAQDINMDIYAPGDTGLYVVCQVQPAGRVNLVIW